MPVRKRGMTSHERSPPVRLWTEPIDIIRGATQGAPILSPVLSITYGSEQRVMDNVRDEIVQTFPRVNLPEVCRGYPEFESPSSSI